MLRSIGSASGHDTAARLCGRHLIRRVVQAGALVIFACAGVPVLATTIVVSNLADSGAGSLRQAIATANAGDTINFAAGLSGPIVLASELPLNQDVSIFGNAAIVLDGNDSVRVLLIAGGVHASLNGLVIQRGFATEAGAGIYSEGRLALTDCVIRSNHAVDRGGGMYIGGGSYALANTRIEDNQSGGDGAGIMDFGLFASSITASRISGNMSGGFGGGINHSSQQLLTISYSTISGNQAATTQMSAGGGIASLDGTLNISYSTISANKAYYAGGVYTNTFSQPAVFNLTASLIAGNTAVSDGGGVFVYGATFNSLNSTIAYNVAHLAMGGGISIASTGSATAAATLTNSTIAFNISTNGGGISLFAGGLVLKNNLIAGNLAATDADLHAAFTSQGYNLVQTRGASSGYGPADLPNGSVANLGELAFNGGPTNTIRPQNGSDAIDQIPTANCSGITLDQRGYRRPAIACDIGAFEVEGAAILFANGFE